MHPKTKPLAALTIFGFLLAALLFLYGASLDRDTTEFDKYDFIILGCNGTYDQVKFARLSAVCDRCFHLAKLPSTWRNCRLSCFRSPFFPACVEALLNEGQLGDGWRNSLIEGWSNESYFG